MKEKSKNTIPNGGPLLVAWLGTITTIILAIVPGIINLLGGPPSEYSPEVAILAATLVAVVWYVYWTYKVVLTPSIENKLKEERRRKNLATALLAELQLTEQTLRLIYLQSPWYYDPFPHPLLSEAIKNLSLFNSSTVEKITIFHNRLLDLKGMYLDRIDKAKGHEDISDIELFIRIKAYLALIALKSLVKELLNDGGTLPEPLLGMECNRYNMPPIPEPVLLKNETLKR